MGTSCRRLSPLLLSPAVLPTPWRNVSSFHEARTSRSPRVHPAPVFSCSVPLPYPSPCPSSCPHTGRGLLALLLLIRPRPARPPAPASHQPRADPLAILPRAPSPTFCSSSPVVITVKIVPFTPAQLSQIAATFKCRGFLVAIRTITTGGEFRERVRGECFFSIVRIKRTNKNKHVY